MPLRNSEIAGLLDSVADFLEIKGENAFRIRAYRNAARTVEGSSREVADILRQGESLRELPGIGRDLAEKIRAAAETGSFPLYDALCHELPLELTRLMKIAGLGGKRIKILHQKLGVSTVEELKRAAEQGRIQGLTGFGEKTQRHILRELIEKYSGQPRMSLAAAEKIATPLAAFLSAVDGVEKVVVAGSYRRRRETVRDLDILAVCRPGSPIMDALGAYRDVKNVISKGETRSSVELRTGMQVDVRVIPAESYGAALHYFTGSREHNIAVRTIGLRKKLKLNEYGVFRGDRRIGGRTEEDVFAAVGMHPIEPELREDRGEIEASLLNKLPHLVTIRDIRGDLHAHTNVTDGTCTLEQMARGAQERGYEYLAITDHSQRLAMARGLDSARLAAHIEHIRAVNESMSSIAVLTGIEVDILDDGTLDLPREILRELDVTVCSVHSKFNLSAREQTRRIVKAMQHPNAMILGHPTGRIIGRRQSYAVLVEDIIKAAQDNQVALELNAHPDRLDLNDVSCRSAREAGVKIAVNTDAHSIAEYDNLRFGVDQARRAWLEPRDVLNTMSLGQLREWIQNKK